jgi:hypothetical protein
VTDTPWITALIQLVTIAGTVINSGLAVLAYVQARRNMTKIHEVRVSIDGRMDQLLAARSTEAHDAGVREGKASGNGDSYITGLLKK